ncbi:hypothetical protein JB92DRAFT_1313531 [Gautieria morchelliformis]|nr:hypothetical protein JB92DRAFT_1313531 [Gautieria morchelliformis]
MSSGSVEDIIVLGGQLQATRYFLVSSLALLIYEHFLTLGDEVRYIWSSRVSLAGFLFFVTRYYVPICLSVITSALTTKWSEAVCLVPIGSLCFLLCFSCKAVGPLEPVGFLTVVVTSSSILLLLRVYALYNRNKWILGYLSSVIVIHFSLSIFFFTFPGGGPFPMPPIDLPVFQGCLYLPSPRTKNGPLAPIALELIYDASIVVLIVAKSWKDRSLSGLGNRSGILRNIVKDGIIYFLVIFSTMFTWLCLGLFAPLGLKLVNAHPSTVLIAIMINRLTISLHRSVKSNTRTSLTLSAVPQNAGPFLPTWMINTQDYSSVDINKVVISDLGDLAPSHESQGIKLVEFYPRGDEFNPQL